jgi:Bacterial low temperature requirement A protein (LtrA)
MNPAWHDGTGHARSAKIRTEEVDAMHVSDQGGLLRARAGGTERVTPLELFFDLVFVFALTQVTGFLADHSTWLGMLKAAALLTVLWSSWASYSWLTNAVPAEEVIPARLVIFCAMAAMFVVSLAVPGAFGHYGVLFGSAYFQLTPIVDDIDAGNVVTRIVRSLHRDALDVGAESSLAHGTIRLVAAHIRPRSE